MTAFAQVEEDMDVIIMRDHRFFFQEGDSAQIDVMRLGNCRHEVQVDYETIPAAGKLKDDVADQSDFKMVSGTITFKAGDFLESFTVPIVDDDNWELMEHFYVKLTRVHQPKYAKLGPLTHSTVYIIDDDEFPANFKKPPGPWRMMLAYLKGRWRRNPRQLAGAVVCRRKTKWVVYRGSKEGRS